MFPRVIFQTWKSKLITHDPYKSWRDTWVNYNRHFQYVLFDDDDNRAFVEKHFPDFLSVYDGYDREIKRADAIRYMFLYVYGGVYVDLDFECLKPFEPFLSQHDTVGTDVVLGRLGHMGHEHYQVHDIPNALMISRPGADFWKLVIFAMGRVKDTKDSHGRQAGPEILTGPILLKACVDFYMSRNHSIAWVQAVYGCDIFEGAEAVADFTSKIFMALPYVFYPINWDDSAHRKWMRGLSHHDAKTFFPTSFAVTYWKHNW